MIGNVVDVIPVENEAWLVQCSDGRHSWRPFLDKSEAIARAKEVAMSSAGCMVIRGLNGEVQSLRYFGERSAAYVS